MNHNNIENLITAKSKELEHVIEVLPLKLGAEAVKFSMQRFRSQNWKGNNRQPWKRRKGNKSKGRGILVKTQNYRQACVIAFLC